MLYLSHPFRFVDAQTDQPPVCIFFTHPAIAQARLLLLASPNLCSLCLTQPHHHYYPFGSSRSGAPALHVIRVRAPFLLTRCVGLQKEQLSDREHKGCDEPEREREERVKDGVYGWRHCDCGRGAGRRCRHWLVCLHADARTKARGKSSGPCHCHLSFFARTSMTNSRMSRYPLRACRLTSRGSAPKTPLGRRDRRPAASSAG